MSNPITSIKPPHFLLINKPAGWTSFDAVNFIRKIARAKSGQKKIRVGHAGTLDPFATGLLIVGVGRSATKKLDEFKNLSKTYVATIRLGATSTTGDPTGVIQENKKTKNQESNLTKKEIKKILKSFIGQQFQTPPMFSAKKIAGKKLYELARAGKIVERQPALIEIYKIKLLDYDYPNLKIEVVCSTGTYIRTLAEEIGEKLKTGAYCAELTRVKIGKYRLTSAAAPADIDFSRLVI